MQQVISFQQGKERSQEKQEVTYKKALLLAQMHVFMNEAEKQRKELYKSYAKAFSESDTNKMRNLSLQITEAGGKLSAFIKCINLVEIEL